jgi:hypothetical protein
MFTPAKDEFVLFLLNEIFSCEVQFKVAEFKLTVTDVVPMSDSLLDNTLSTLASKVAENFF